MKLSFRLISTQIEEFTFLCVDSAPLYAGMLRYFGMACARCSDVDKEHEIRMFGVYSARQTLDGIQITALLPFEAIGWARGVNPIHLKPP